MGASFIGRNQGFYPRLMGRKLDIGLQELMVQLSLGSTQTVSAVVIASGIRGRLRCIRFVVLGFDYVIDLATGFLVV
jgi:hypothetical protein